MFSLTFLPLVLPLALPPALAPGNLFFGNIEQLFLHLREVLHCMPHLLFLVLDTGELAGIDFSARDRLAKMCRSMTGEGGREKGKRGGRKVHLVWAGLHKSVKEKLRAGKCFGEEDGAGKSGKIQAALAVKGPGRRGGGSGRGEGWGWASLARGKQMHHFARDLNKAFTFCEDTILAAVGALDEEEEESEEERKTAQGPGLRPGGKRDGDTKVGLPSPPVSFAGGGAPTGREFLHRTLRKLARRAPEAVDEGILARLLSSFTQESLPARATLWRRNDPSTFACIVQKGVLGVPRLKEDPSVSASLAQAPGCLLSGTLPPSSPSSSSLPSTRLNAGTRFRANSHSDVADDEEEDVRTRYTHHSYPDLVSLASTVGGKPGHFREYSLPGQMCGELGLFTRGLRKYTMVAITEAVIWRLDAGRLKKMRVEDPQAYIVMQGIVLSYASHRLNCLMLQGQLHSV
jgi:CRP-like cAMP-binding protein